MHINEYAGYFYVFAIQDPTSGLQKKREKSLFGDLNARDFCSYPGRFERFFLYFYTTRRFVKFEALFVYKIM